MGEILLFNKFFSNCQYVSQLVCADGDFLAIFWVLHFQPAARSTFQTCILNSHYGRTMCRSVVDIQSATAEIRRGKRKKKERR